MKKLIYLISLLILSPCFAAASFEQIQKTLGEVDAKIKELGEKIAAVQAKLQQTPQPPTQQAQLVTQTTPQKILKKAVSKQPQQKTPSSTQKQPVAR